MKRRSCRKLAGLCLYTDDPTTSAEPTHRDYIVKKIRIKMAGDGIIKHKCFGHLPKISEEDPVSRESRKLFESEKPFVKLRPTYSVKLVFSYVVKGTKIKITAKFRASRRHRFEDTKRTMSEMRQKSFGTFEKRAPGRIGQTTNVTLQFSEMVQANMALGRQQGQLKCYHYVTH